jgi:hypothetical protein
MVLFAVRTPFVLQYGVAQHSHFIQRIAVLPFKRTGSMNEEPIQNHDEIVEKKPLEHRRRWQLQRLIGGQLRFDAGTAVIDIGLRVFVSSEPEES